MTDMSEFVQQLDERGAQLTDEECAWLIDVYRRGCISLYYRDRHATNFAAATYLIYTSNHPALVRYRSVDDEYINRHFEKRIEFHPQKNNS